MAANRFFLGLILLMTALTAMAEESSFETSFAACEAEFAADPEGTYTCGCFYDVAHSAGLVMEAQRRFEGHLRTYSNNPCLLFFLGLLQTEMGEVADEEFQRAAELYSEQERFSGEIYSRLNLIREWRRQGRRDEALEQQNLASSSAERSGNGDLVFKVKLESIRYAREDGTDLLQLDRRLRNLSATISSETPQQLVHDLLMEQSQVAYLRGRYQDVQHYQSELLAIAQSRGDLYGEAKARLNLAIVFIAQSPTPRARQEAMRWARDALTAAEATQIPSIEADARLLYARLQDGEVRLNELTAAVETARQSNNKKVLSAALSALAAALAEVEPMRAQELLAESSAVVHDVEDAWIDIYQWLDRLQAAWTIHPFETALSESMKTLDLVEDVRNFQGGSGEPGSGERVEVFAVWTEVHQWLAGYLFQLARSGEHPEILNIGFQISERMRARELLEAPENSHRLSEDHKEVLREFAALNNIEEELETDEALLSFQVRQWENIYGGFAGGSWLIVSTHQGSRAYRLPDQQRIDSAVELFTGLFHERSGPIGGKPAESLYKMLLKSALDELPKTIERLVIVPEGLLHELPFAALGHSDSPSLIERYELTMAPSATFWLDQRRSSDGRNDRWDALILADPLLLRDDAMPAEVRDWSTTGARLGPLPHARREGRAAARHLGSESRLLVADEASEEELLTTDLSKVRILHFATHAVLDEEFPERSAVILSPGDEQHDGLLQPREIAALDLNGAIVVLSTCQGADGAVVEGEGLLSLSRAFFMAGAQTVVASLWPLRDDRAADLLALFYRHVGDGHGVAEAMAEAQREMIRQGQPPKNWAGVVVLGHGASVPRPGGVPRAPRWDLLLGALTALVVAYGLWHFVRRI